MCVCVKQSRNSIQIFYEGYKVFIKSHIFEGLLPSNGKETQQIGIGTFK